MHLHDFIQKWRASTLKERSAAHEHFIDLCRLLDERTPAEADPEGVWYCFERGATKTAGGKGWADVWRRGCFGWEYKGKRANLDDAFAQLQRYAIALENPPLLIVSDIETIRIHTNFTNTVQQVHTIELDDLEQPEKRRLLKWAFAEPERLKPGTTREAVTERAASEFAALAQRLRDRGHDPQRVAHFINRLLFCMFAEDIGLLRHYAFSRLLQAAHDNPRHAAAMLSQLFAAMRTGGAFGPEPVDWFNGGLFDDDEALPLERDDIARLLRAARLDWSDIEPSIFGTLFERGLDPDKRSQLGAHYTDRGKIMMIVEPVVLTPLRNDWELAKKDIGERLRRIKTARARMPKNQADARRIHRLALEQERRAWNAANRAFNAFLSRLRNYRVLDPACGSGNFLYLALVGLKDLEHHVLLDAEAMGLERQFPAVGPECVRGIEINPYAAELARATVWIGEIQWMQRNGFGVNRNPILKPLDNIECRDAVLNPDGTEAEWPIADVVIGNPPFLGNKRMIDSLGADYVRRLRAAYSRCLSGGVDLVMYWFQKAWDLIDSGRLGRAGLVSTNSIRSGANRAVLSKIAESGAIYDAWSDEPWVIEGAAVRVSLVCFSKQTPPHVRLDGNAVASIHSDLTASAFDVTKSARLQENIGVCFVGVILNGEFEVEPDLARQWLQEPANVNGRLNSDVLRPTFNGDDFNGERNEKWIIDFGISMSESDAAMYEKPFQYVLKRVKPYRQRKDNNGNYIVRAKNEREIWWRHARPRPAMRKALDGKKKFIATPMVSSIRTFDFLAPSYLPDQKLVVFAKDDNAFYGIVHSRYHLAWTIRTCSWIGAGNDITYSNQAVFLTFPFPEGLTPNLPVAEYATDRRAVAIAQAAKRLNELRENWLNPPELVKRVPEVVPGYPDRILPVDDRAAAILKQRTLTDLYNERPAWLANAHRDLDEAVAAAYGWPADLDDEEVLRRLFELNRERARVGASPVPAAAD